MVPSRISRTYSVLGSGRKGRLAEAVLKAAAEKVVGGMALCMPVGVGGELGLGVGETDVGKNWCRSFLAWREGGVGSLQTG